MLSRNLEQSLHRALALANERRHEYATLEHLLLALTEDQDAVAVLRAARDLLLPPAHVRRRPLVPALLLLPHDDTHRPVPRFAQASAGCVILAALWGSSSSS